MKAGIAATAAAAALLLGSSGTAGAAVVSDMNGTATYVALPGETNNVVVTRDGQAVVITDQTQSLALVSTPGCATDIEHRVRCLASNGVDLELGDGNDTATVKGYVIAKVAGGSGDDVLRGGAASDQLDGGDGSDTLDGGLGADVIDGGSGNDTVDYSSRTASVNVSLDRNANDGETAEGDNVVSVERVIGGSGDDLLTGSDSPDELDGGPGNDVIVGLGGNDIVNGGPGDDALGGYGGVDVLIGGPGRDGINALDPSPQDDKVDCGDGSDRVFADGSDGVNGDCEAVDRTGVLGFTARVAPPVSEPELGASVVVRPIIGTVLVTPPRAGGSRTTMQPVPAGPAVPLDGERNVPVGTVVDTRLGTVGLTIATDHNGTTNSGQFHDGTFQVFQATSPGSFATLALRGGKAFGACPVGERGRVAVFARHRRRRGGGSVRSVWGTATGAFRTQARFASATIRGTEWLTQDSCAGTLVRVKHGEVAVRDLRSGRLVIVRAGQQYLVRAARR